MYVCGENQMAGTSKLKNEKIHHVVSQERCDAQFIHIQQRKTFRKSFQYSIVIFVKGNML